MFILQPKKLWHHLQLSFTIIIMFEVHFAGVFYNRKMLLVFTAGLKARNVCVLQYRIFIYEYVMYIGQDINCRITYNRYLQS
jgi:hypothetical protein